MSKIFLVLVVILVVNVERFDAYKENDFTVQVPSMKRECYYQSSKKDQTMDIEYQVIEGGDLDIDFSLQAPSGRVILREMRKSDGMHTVEPTEEGDYIICFDNTFSRMTGKTVFFDIVEDAAGIEDDEDEDYGWKNNVVPDESYGDKLVGFDDTMSQIKSNLGKTFQVQALLRAFEAKDRGIAERNFTRVNFWSLFNICAMCSVCFLQVYTIRSMFRENRKTRT